MIRSFNLPDHEIVEGPLDGGMAHVYIARHLVLGRRVAIKVIRPEFVADSGFSARFVREARIVSRIDHPNVVKLYQVGERDGKPYYVMEYLAGGELKNRIHSSAPVGKTGQQYGARYACELTLAEVLRIAKDVASALSVAHHQGYVHRDIKPSNIMFRTDNSVVVTDFGIAKAIEPDKTQSDMTVTHGAVIGTPLYMSPEQVDCTQLGVTQLDGRADLYSLGAVLYYAMTGHPPFTADTPFQLGLKHLSAAVPKLPPYLRHYQPFILRCMAKRPADRFASAEELATEIERLQKTHPRTAIPLDEPLPRFELPWLHEESPTERFFHSVANLFSPIRVAALVAVIALVVMVGFWLGTRTSTENLLSVVETEQRAIDTLLSGSFIEFDQAFEKIEYTENLLKIQPNNPTSINQLNELQKKLESQIYDEVTNNQFDAARQHITTMASHYANWPAKADLDIALSEAEKKWQAQQQAAKRKSQQEAILVKMDAAVAQRQFEQLEAFAEEAKRQDISSQEIELRLNRMRELLAAEKAQAEQQRQQRIQNFVQRAAQAKKDLDLAAMDEVIAGLKTETAVEQVQQAGNDRQQMAEAIAERKRAELQQRESDVLAQLELQQNNGSLEPQFAVWQSVTAQPFQTQSGVARAQSLKRRVEQRVTQLIRAEVKSGRYDVAEIWSNDARARGMSLPWEQFTRPPEKLPEPAQAVTVPEVKSAQAETPASSAASTKRSAEPVSEPVSPAKIEIPVAQPNPPAPAEPVKQVVQVAPIAPSPAVEPIKPAPPPAEVKTKPQTHPREVQVIGF